MNKTHTPPPHSYATLARRLSSITSRVLLSAVIVVAGVGVGRQVLVWWREAADVPPQTPLPVPPLGDPSAVHEVAIADRPWAIVQQSFQGDAGAAADALLTACEHAAEKTEAMLLPPPGPEEQELLGRLERAEPQRRSLHGVSLYAIREAVPLVVGTRTASRTDSSGKESQTAADGLSVAVWGMAVPASADQWNLYTFRPSVPSSEQDGLLPQPPVPPQCQRLFQMRAIGGDASIVFTDRSGTDTCRTFYDGWAAETGLETTDGWQESGGIWHVTYRTTDPRTPAVVRIHLDASDGEVHRGVVLVVPR